MFPFLISSPRLPLCLPSGFPCLTFLGYPFQMRGSYILQNISILWPSETLTASKMATLKWVLCPVRNDAVKSVVEWRCDATHSLTWHYMEVSGQLSKRAVLTLLKYSPMSVKQEAVCTQATDLASRRRKYVVPAANWTPTVRSCSLLQIHYKNWTVDGAWPFVRL